MSSTCPRFGFYLRAVLHPETEPRTVVRLRDSFREVAGSRGLSYTIGGTIRHWMHLVWREGSQAEHADREALKAWASAQPEVATVEVGPLADLDER